eukprot:Skav224665  [mRNA]  locus=scaffold3549:40950:49503:+ [translate_table: standard]
MLTEPATNKPQQASYACHNKPPSITKLRPILSRPIATVTWAQADRLLTKTSRHGSLTMDIDLLNPDAKEETLGARDMMANVQERSKHKLKRMIQSPNSFFMDVKCPGCLQITTVFSHAQTVVLCGNCNVMLCQPTGGGLLLQTQSRLREAQV